MLHLPTDDEAFGHADDRVEPENMQHLEYAQEQVVSIVDGSHSNNSRRLKQRTSHNSTAQKNPKRHAKKCRH